MEKNLGIDYYTLIFFFFLQIFSINDAKANKNHNSVKILLGHPTDVFGPPVRWAEEKPLTKYVYAAYRISSLLTKYVLYMLLITYQAF